jgi:hypothetical protein
MYDQPLSNVAFIVYHLDDHLPSLHRGWSPAQYLLFEMADKISTPSIRSFEVDCLLRWNHYQYTGYYSSMPAAIVLLSVLCYVVGRALIIPDTAFSTCSDPRFVS